MTLKEFILKRWFEIYKNYEKKVSSDFIMLLKSLLVVFIKLFSIPYRIILFIVFVVPFPIFSPLWRWVEEKQEEEAKRTRERNSIKLNNAIRRKDLENKE